MSAYKLNRLHLHLSDDEGWRIEIPGLPELTEVGGQRCFDPSEMHCLLPQLASGPENQSGGGYLTREQFVSLLRYAADRFIEVIPEIDMPGHARAAVMSMEARYRRLHAEGRVNMAAQDKYAAGVSYELGVTHHVDMASLNRDWAGFATVLKERELPKLARAGVGYRQPTFTLTGE